MTGKSRKEQLVDLITLSQIDGVGVNRLHQLISAIGSAEKVLGSPVGQLAEIRGFSRELASRIHEQQDRAAADKIAKNANITKISAKRALETVIDTIISETKNGNKTTLAGFGIFESKQIKPRKGFNPKTRETIDIPAKKKITFKPSKYFKDVIND